MTGKRDFKRELPSYTARLDTPEVIDVPDLQYLVIDGHGDPNTPVHAAAVAALYPVAYRVKARGKDLGRDHVVMPLEGLWWADRVEAFTTARDKTRWDWTLMIMVPDWVTADLVSEVVGEVRSLRRPERVDDVRLQALSEGRCVQVLHVGAYDDEAEVLRHLHEEFLPEGGFTAVGKHHEIYLSDPRRTEPGKRRTILRQPVAEA